MLRKFIKTVISLTACLGLANLPILADDSNGTVTDGDFNGISEQGRNYYYSEEHQNNLKAKFEKMNIIAPRDATKLLSIPHYTQDNSTYCGPASAQVIIQYIAGQYIGQKTLADQMGTGVNGTNVDSYTPILAAYTGLNYEFTNNNQYYFYNNMVQDINGNCPITYDVDPYYFDIGYSHMGHYVVGNGYGAGDICYYWDVNGNFADQWHISASEMSQALNGNGGYYVW